VYDQRMQRICHSLAETGYEVLLTGRKLRSSPPLVPALYQQSRLPCLFNKGKMFYAEYNIRLFFFFLFKKADCICAIDLDTILPCWFVSKLKGIKRVYDAHEYFSQLDEVISRPSVYRFWHWIEKKMIPRFPLGYTVCESLSEEFKKNFRANYAVVRNVPVLTENNEQERQKNVILYQGAVNRGRGLENLVMAMKSMNAELWVCGDGNFMDEMKKAVTENNLENKVKFFGMLSPEELKIKTKQAYIAVNPFEKTGLNQYLSLSNKFFDYIHAGTPQVTMNYPEYRRLNDECKVAYLIDDLSPGTIAAAFEKLILDKELYGQLKQNCVAARKVWCWQNEKDKLVKFYHQHINE
jgi:glycosyltransferase involved in cell wall biosynthesis